MSTQHELELRSPELNAHLDGFFKAVRILGENASYRHIGGVLERNAELTEEIKRLKNTEDVNIAQIARLGQQLDEAQQQAREREDELAIMRKNIQTVNDLVRAAEGTVQKKEESLRKAEDNSKTLMETLKKHEADSIAHEAEARQMEEQLRDSRKNESVLRGERELAAEQLREKTEMLDEINNWRLQMKKIDETERDETATKLQGLFTEAYSMVKKYFGDDVPDQIGKDAKAWEALRGHVAVSHPYKIPLPSSNSPQAKQMRVAAVLAVLGHHLAEQILQPLFILEDGGELNEFLSELASDDPPREAFLRSTLLAALTSADQRENRQERVKDVFQAVISAAQPLLADGKRDGFRRALRDLCARYCETWSEIQHLEDKIEWSLDVDEPDNFELLQLPNPAGETASEATSNNQASGTPKTGSNRPPNSSVSQLSRPSSNTASQLRGNEAIVAPVWPCFILVRRGGGELVAKGFALGEAQIKVAKSEASSLRRSLTGNHREARHRGARTLSKEVDSKAANSFFIHKWIRRAGGQLISGRRGR